MITVLFFTEERQMQEELQRKRMEMKEELRHNKQKKIEQIKIVPVNLKHPPPSLMDNNPHQPIETILTAKSSEEEKTQPGKKILEQVKIVPIKPKSPPPVPNLASEPLVSSATDNTTSTTTNADISNVSINNTMSTNVSINNTTATSNSSSTGEWYVYMCLITLTLLF